MAPKSSRRTRPARQLPSDPANLPVVSADVWEMIFSFMLRIHRLPLLCVCKAWREAGLADADLWRFLVVTCESVTVNVAAMAPQRRLPHIHGEYTPSRAVLNALSLAFASAVIVRLARRARGHGAVRGAH